VKGGHAMPDPIETTIPGRNAIELVAYYEEFRDYYPYCELQTKRWFVEHVRTDWWIFDVGANVGYYTILFSELAPRGRVFAFEPTATAKMLRANLRHSGVENAEIHEVALAATTGEREDRIYRLWGTEGEVKTYPFYSLDDFIAQHRIDRVDCLKIDVDSFDFEVLRGAERTLADRNPVVLVELNHALARRNQSVGELSRGWHNVAIARRWSWTTTTSCCSEALAVRWPPGTSRAWSWSFRHRCVLKKPYPPRPASLSGAPSSARWTCRRESLSRRRRRAGAFRGTLSRAPEKS
jgi:FkbM family methyltransferase